MKPRLPGFIYPALVLLCTHTAMAQKTVPVSKNKEDYVEEYSVLASDKKVKHGLYLRLDKLLMGGFAIEFSGNYDNGKRNGLWEMYYSLTNNIRERGFYKNDLRDSTWLFFYPQRGPRKLVEVQSTAGTALEIRDANPVVSKTGNYRDDKPVGIWEFFDSREVVNQRFDYNKNRLTYLAGGDTSSHQAGYLGGEYALNQQLYSTLDFSALLNSINSTIDLEPGKLVFTFTISEKGEVKDIVNTIKTIENKKIYARALETIESMKGQWYPKLVDNKPQNTSKTITFDMDVNSSTKWSSGPRDSYSMNTTRGFRMKVTVE